MDLKSNINKIHHDLTNLFGEVEISEKSNLKFGNYVELSVKNEGKQVKMMVPKINLEGYFFNWSYSENPLNENADLVERTSSVDSVVDDVKNIFDKNRFSEDYLKELNK